MRPQPTNRSAPVDVSIAVFAWNEERAIASAIESLFQQTLFCEVPRRGYSCEVICVSNGCADRTAVIARQAFERQHQAHSFANFIFARVADIPERGKLNAWNKFVHEHSARDARFLFMMDADILLHRHETLWNMLITLERDPQAYVSVDRPCKDLGFKKERSLRERFSLAASQATLAADAQLCAQLYCIRSTVARNIYLPGGLSACEDGFIKTLVCTDFLTRELQPHRIRVAPEAEHIFEAYTSPMAILRNQKRQVIGQTIVHVLIDKTLRTWPLAERKRMAATLQAKEIANPDWVKCLIAVHIERISFCWQLYPGLLSHSWRRLRKLSGWKRVTCLPAAALRFIAELLGSFLAYRALKAGLTDYWPQANRMGLKKGDLGNVSGAVRSVSGGAMEKAEAPGSSRPNTLLSAPAGGNGRSPIPVS